MEQSHSGEVHDDAVLVAGLDDDIISHRTARLSYVPDTTAVSTLDIVAEREERVGAESYAVHLVEPGSLFLSRQRFRSFGEELLPLSIGQHIHIIIADVHIDSVISVRLADIISERQIQHLRILSQEPVISLLSGQSGAVDTGLLARSYPNGLSALGVTYGIGLSIF